jgi:hypothetical protein
MVDDRPTLAFLNAAGTIVLSVGSISTERVGLSANDANGKIATFVGTEQGGTNPVVEAFYPKGRRALALGCGDFGPALAMFGEDGSVRGFVGTQQDKSVRLALCGMSGIPIAAISVASDSKEASFGIANADGKSWAMQLRKSTNGERLLELFDSDGQRKTDLCVDHEQLPGLEFHGPKGRVAAMSVSKVGEPGIEFDVPGSGVLGGMRVYQKALHIDMFDEKGNSTFRAP